MPNFETRFLPITTALATTALLAIASSAAAQPRDTLWIDDALPPGAITSSGGGDTWTWVQGDPTQSTHWIAGDPTQGASTPLPSSGALSHLSNLAAGAHWHGFTGATDPFPVLPGDNLVTHIYVDPLNVPQEIKIDLIDTLGHTVSYYLAPNMLNDPLGGGGYYAGIIPPAGRWVRVEVPASKLRLENNQLSGMKFRLFGGRAAFDRSGSIRTNAASWFEDALPSGAIVQGNEPWQWVPASAGPVYSGGAAHQSALSSGLHEHGFIAAGQPVSIPAGATLSTYVFLEASAPARELMLSFYDGAGWEHRAYWGANAIARGTDDTASRRWVGPLPPTGQWIRLEVPASLLGLEGKSITGMMFTLQDGRATFDRAGWGPSPLAEEAIGPFANWINVKTAFGAAGDGITDDTQALQKALDSLASRQVLYFPAGTYRITDTLFVRDVIDPNPNLSKLGRFGITIIGDSPDTTTIRWDGTKNNYPANPGATPIAMLDLKGVAYSKLSRLTWDGRSSLGANADVAVFHHNAGGAYYFGTALEHSDEVFRDVQFGIWGGITTPNDNAGIAETAVKRCAFIRCTMAGLYLDNWNSLDWWVQDSYFSGCFTGLADRLWTYHNQGMPLDGAGGFHVYRSLFRGSVYSDISTGNVAGFAGFRGNTSVSSNLFYVGGIYGINPITFQGNILLDSCIADSAYGTLAISEINMGPALVADNFVRCNPYDPAHPNALMLGTQAGAGVVTIGNTFTMPNAKSLLALPGTQHTLDDQENVGAQIQPWPVTAFPGPAPNYHRTVVEVVPTGIPAQDNPHIQTAVQNVVPGTKTVVHLQYLPPPAPEFFFIDSTITIPSGSDVQLAGDGIGATGIYWSGAGNAPMIAVAGTSRATVRDLGIDGLNQSSAGPVCLDIQLRDVSESHLYADQLASENNYDANLRSDGLDFAAVELEHFQHGEVAQGTSVTVTGGPGLAFGLALPGRVGIYAGASGINEPYTYDVASRGRLVVTDTWYEGHSAHRLMRLAGSGTFTLSGGMVADGDGEVFSEPQIELDGFDGLASFLQIDLYSSYGAHVTGNGTKTRALFLMNRFDGDGHLKVNPAAIFDDSAPAATVSDLDGTVMPSGSAGSVATNSGPDDPQALRAMLMQVRAERPGVLPPAIAGVSNVSLYRVSAVRCAQGVRVHP